MQSNCSKNLLNLEDVKLKNVKHTLEGIIVLIETGPKPQRCPCCGSETSKIHDYRWKKMKNMPFQLSNAYLLLRKRRYVCSCGKRFYGRYRFIAKYQQRTTRLSFKIVELLRSTSSIKYVAAQTNVSSNTVTRILDTLSYEKPHIPLCIQLAITAD